MSKTSTFEDFLCLRATFFGIIFEPLDPTSSRHRRAVVPDLFQYGRQDVSREILQAEEFYFLGDNAV
jgi:hypothetical protein